VIRSGAGHLDVVAVSGGPKVLAWRRVFLAPVLASTILAVVMWWMWCVWMAPHGKAADNAELERQEREPEAFGRFIVEAGGEPAGTLSFERANHRSSFANCGGFAIHPRLRGRHLGDDAARLFQRHLIFDLGFHRLQLEIYGYNERAQRHAERAGWIKEGVKRMAYRRGDEWVDGVIYGLVREDLEA
jgi:RimJ/RimL family protein N-acetyltransferase